MIGTAQTPLVAFFVYACTVCSVTMLYKLPASMVASASILLWLALAFGLEIGIGR
jgi:Na+/citrate or Na+/malate symporter